MYTFKMRHVTSRLARQGFSVEKTFIDAVSVARKRIYIGVTVSGEPDPEAAAFDIDAAVGKFASVIEVKQSGENGNITCLLAVNLVKLALVAQYDAAKSQLENIDPTLDLEPGSH